MFKRTKVCTGLLLAFGGSMMLGAMPAKAQSAAPTATDRVEVTGSRILSVNAESAAPVQVITSEDIAASGATNIQELLLKNPTFGTPTISRTNSNFQTSSVGVATIDLRNLGTNRTLVLVNGRRFVSGVPGDTAVDLNAIPTQFVERIDILTGGASSTYGSDAVAGVVNIILKKDFEGVAFDAKAGQSERGDDTRKEFSVTFGSTAADGKGNLMGHFGYSKQGAVYSRDRSASAIDQNTESAFSGDPADFFKPRRPFYSSYAPQGRFFTDTGSFTYDAQGNVIPFSTNGPALDGVGATGFNRSDFRTIAVPTERYLFAGKGNYQLSENHSAFFEGTYSASKTTSRLEPFPLGAESIYPATGGQVPAEFLVNGALVRNPIVPDALFNNISDTDGDGLRDYYFTRRLSEVGSRGNIADRDTFRLAAGFEGALTKGWDYNVFAAYGVTKEAQTSSGQVNVLNFRNALEAVADVDDIDGDGNTAEAICRDGNARAQGCVPINIFGYNTISPTALAYVTAPGLLNTYTKQQLLGGSVTGEPFTLPAGPVGVAVGFEYRDEFARSEFDPLQQAGLNAGNAIPRTEGSFDVKELFAEARVPLLKNAPLAKSLNLTAAVRGGKYSTVGNTTSWNTGMDWSPTSGVMLRATHAVSTRAPNINELYSPPSQTFPADLNDPCAGVTATSTGSSDAACRADPGVAASIAATGAYTPNQSDIQGISGYDRGNPNLGAEKGKSWTLGLAFTPKGVPILDKMAFTVDYFNIKVADAIVSTPRQFILDQCYGGDASFCQFITRRPANVGANTAGSIEFIDSAVTNSGDLVTEGIDLTANYSDRVGPGMLNARLSWTYLMKGYVTPLPGAAKDPFLGEIGAARNKGSLTLGYQFGNFGVTAQTTYIGASALDDQFLAGYDLAAGSVKVGAKVYNDFQFTYTPAKAVELYLGIDNAFDVKAPPIISGLPGSVTGTETAADVYDPIGRRYYAGVRMKF